MHVTNFFELLFLVSATVFGTLGIIAVVSPRLFTRIASSSSRWVDSGKYLEFMDQKFDIDQYVLKHSRILGLLVLFAVSFLAYLILTAKHVG